MSREYDLVVVGLGSAGLVAVEFACALGLRVAAVEAERIGGDCLWTGCVPSKALIASARAAHAMRTADRYGIAAVEPEIDLRAVWARIREIQRGIAETDDSPEHVRELGAELVLGRARLAGPNEVEVEGRRLATRYVLLATGSRPSVPPIAGLERAGYLTNETIFELDDPPRSLAIVGGGPIGVELAQATRRLGIEVTLLQAGDRLLPRDEPSLAEAVERILRAEGVDVRLGANAQAASGGDGGRALELADGSTVRAEAILVAAGREAVTEGLGLESAGIEVGEKGVAVDDKLRTSADSVYAVGDLAGRFLFTHNAAHEAAIAVRNMFFPLSSEPAALVPWCTFTEPELASAGLTSEQAAEKHGGDARVWRHPLTRSDRARADGATEGELVLVTAGEKLVGAHVLSPAAGEVIQSLAAAIAAGKRLRDLAGLVHVYPTYSTAIQQLAGEAAYEYGSRWARRLRVGR